MSGGGNIRGEKRREGWGERIRRRLKEDNGVGYNRQEKKREEKKKDKQKNRRGNAAERIEGSRSSAEAAEKLIVLWGAEFCVYRVQRRPFFLFLFFSNMTKEQRNKREHKNSSICTYKRDNQGCYSLLRTNPSGDISVEYQGPGIYHTVTIITAALDRKALRS